MRKNSLYIVILLLSFTHCVANAQWVLTNCPQGPQCLEANEQYIFSGGEGGAFRSSDYGNTWEAINKGLKSDLNPSTVVSYYTIGNYVISALSYASGIFLSTDNGDHWIKNSYSHLAFGYFSHHNNYLFTTSGNTSGVFRSLDSGNTWALDTNGIFPFGRINLKAYFNPPAVVGNVVIVANYEGQVFRSENNGDYWHLIYDRIAGRFLRFYAINDSIVLATMSDSILRSTDFGISWKNVKQGIGSGKILTVDNKIFAVQGYNLFISTNNGDSWESVYDNLPDSTVIDALVVKDNYLFAGGYNQGLWRRPLSDFATVNSFTPSSIQKLNSVVASRNPFGSETTLIVDLNDDEYMKLEVYDVLGNKLYSDSKLFVKGKNDWQLNGKLFEPATLYARVSTMGGEVMTIKLLHQ